MGTLLGDLPVVCSRCRRVNEPVASICAACGSPLVPAAAPAPGPAAHPAPKPAAPAPKPTAPPPGHRPPPPPGRPVAAPPLAAAPGAVPVAPKPTAPPHSTRPPPPPKPVPIPANLSMPPAAVAPKAPPPSAPPPGHRPPPPAARAPAAPRSALPPPAVKPVPAVSVAPAAAVAPAAPAQPKPAAPPPPAVKHAPVEPVSPRRATPPPPPEPTPAPSQPLPLEGAILATQALDDPYATLPPDAMEAPAAEPAVEAGPSLKLVVVRGASAGSAFRIGLNAVGAGRSKGVLLFPDDPFLAPLHASFRAIDGKMVLRDENGPSGVFVRLTGPELLPSGGEFALGSSLVRFTGPLTPPPPGQLLAYGSPVPAGLLCRLEEILEGNRAGRTVVRPGPVLSIGRAGCDLDLKLDALVQPRHCEVVVDPSGAVLRDLGTPEGTFIRVAPGSERTLSPGDVVRFGLEELRVEVE